MIDTFNTEDDVETIIVASGGGSRGLWQWTLLLLIAARFRISMICGTSTGALSAYGFGKGPQAQAYVSKVYEEVFANRAAPITNPGLAEIAANGKIGFNMKNVKKYLLKGINFWDIFKLVREKDQKKLLSQLLNNFLSAPSLLDNAPLYERIREIQAINPGWVTPAFWNRVNMRNGRLEQSGYDTTQTPEEEVDSVVASTTIPILWPLVKGIWADGGLREGTPLAQIFERLDPSKKYRIIMLECQRDEMPEDASLDNPLHIASQMLSISMNESRRNDVKQILDKNEEAREKGEAAGRLYIPVYRLRYPGDFDSLDFSKEAKEDFVLRAHQVHKMFISEFDSK